MKTRAHRNRPKHRRWGLAVAALWSAFQVAACESPTEPTPPTEPRPAIQQVSDLVPGRMAHLDGRGLEGVTALSIDGVPVSIQTQSGTRLSFQVPELRPCETDGRRVQVVAEGVGSAGGRMQVAEALELRVGESRILSTEELSCLRLRRGAEAYLVSVQNFSTGRERADILSFRTLGAGGQVPGFLAAPAGHAAFAAGRGHAHGHVLGEAPVAQGPWVGIGEFDDYASMEVGDVREFVDWGRLEDLFAATSREEVPIFFGKVLATHGTQVVVLDLSIPGAGTLDTPEFREKMHAAAGIADRVMVQALRDVVDPGFQLPNTAGGRALHMVRTLPSGVAGAAQGNEINGVRWSSGLFMTLLAYVEARDAVPEAIARVMLHEAAHLAVFSDPRYRLSGWYDEAIAVAVEDRAARLSRGDVLPSPAFEVGTSISGIASSPETTSSTFSPWGPINATDPGSTSRGAYQFGARILRHAMHRFDPANPWRFHQELLNRNHREFGSREARLAAWSIDHFAEILGTTREELLRDVMLEDLTHGFLDPNVARSEGIPVNPHWAPRPGIAISTPTLRQENILSRAQSTARRDLVPAGSYLYWYIDGAPTDGLSIEANHVSTDPNHQVRITRLR